MMTMMMMTLKQKYLQRVDENINQLSCVKRNMLIYLEAIKKIQSQSEGERNTPNLDKKRENLEKSLEMFMQVYREVEDPKFYEMNQKLKDGYEEMVLNNNYFQVQKQLTQLDFIQVNAIMRNEKKYTFLKQSNMIKIQSPSPQLGQNSPNFQIIIFVNEIRSSTSNNSSQHSSSYFSVKDLLVCPLSLDSHQRQIYIPQIIPQIFKEISNFAKIAQKKLDLSAFLDIFFPSAQIQSQQKQDYIQRVFSAQSECNLCKNYMKFKSTKEGFVPPTILYNFQLYHFACFKDNELL